MSAKSDIEIAQEAQLEKITEVAKRLGLMRTILSSMENIRLRFLKKALGSLQIIKIQN